MKILQDIATAVKLTGEVRKVRKAGASGVEIKPVYTIPAVRFGYWGFTVEGCLFYGPKWQPLRDVFDSFPEETQHELTFAPKDDFHTHSVGYPLSAEETGGGGMTLEEKKNRYPNLWRVAEELARCKHPDKVLDALKAMIQVGEVEL